MQNRARSGWQVGSVFGIPLMIDSSWIFIVGLVTLANGLAWKEEYPTWETWQVWGAGLQWRYCYLHLCCFTNWVIV